MIPSFYDATKCGTLFVPRLAIAAEEGRRYAKVNNIPAAEQTAKTRNVILSIIDPQIDFIAPPPIGNLSVEGAVADTDRLNRFIFNNIEALSHIVVSLDTHYLYQPFHPMSWVAGSTNNIRRAAGPLKGQAYAEGDHPEPFTLITLKDVQSNVWLPTKRPQRMHEMLHKLETEGKKTLCIWPIHCILGSPGHAVDPTLMEAIFFFSAARRDQYDFTEKGMSQSSEHYGILRAEVQFQTDPLTQLNTHILNRWQKADVIYFAGQAKSHCVLETLNQVVEIFSKQSPEVLQRLRVLSDCTSSVPDIKDDNGKVLVPFDQIAEKRFKELERMGVQFVKSTDPITD